MSSRTAQFFRASTPAFSSSAWARGLSPIAYLKVVALTQNVRSAPPAWREFLLRDNPWRPGARLRTARHRVFQFVGGEVIAESKSVPPSLRTTPTWMSELIDSRSVRHKARRLAWGRQRLDLQPRRLLQYFCIPRPKRVHQTALGGPGSTNHILKGPVPCSFDGNEYPPCNDRGKLRLGG